VERLQSATSRPIYATCRRDPFYRLLRAGDVVSLTDSERTDRLVAVVEPELAGIDVKLDAFDRTHGPGVVH